MHLCTDHILSEAFLANMSSPSISLEVKSRVAQQHYLSVMLMLILLMHIMLMLTMLIVRGLAVCMA